MRKKRDLILLAQPIKARRKVCEYLATGFFAYPNSKHERISLADVLRNRFVTKT